jgi:hypothetical protein
MPVKRRRSKARPESARAWLMFMMSGSDFFDDLVDAGIIQAGETPSRGLAEEVWRHMGADVLDAMDDLHVGFQPPERPIWAEREFGQPGRRRIR